MDEYIYEPLKQEMNNYSAKTMKTEDALLENVKGDLSTWFMMSSIYPVIGLGFVYLVFVLYLGPSLMKNRKPLDLSRILLAYNTGQVAFSLWWLIKATSNWPALNYVYCSVFHPQLHITDETFEKQIDELGYYYLMSKYIELLDTVFFILRHKSSQVTFLHVYHHANMAVSTWFYVKYIWGRHIIFIGLVNVFIHVIMYSYYLLTAMGPAIRPYLWWKRYITKMQMGQFLLILVYVAVLVLRRCPFQQSFVIFTACNTASFLLLFFNFYKNAYSARSKNLKTS